MSASNAIQPTQPPPDLLIPATKRLCVAQLLQRARRTPSVYSESSMEICNYNSLGAVLHDSVLYTTTNRCGAVLVVYLRAGERVWDETLTPMKISLHQWHAAESIYIVSRVSFWIKCSYCRVESISCSSQVRLLVYLFYIFSLSSTALFWCEIYSLQYIIFNYI